MNNKKLSETTKAYLAGIIDGEGSLYIHRDYRKGNIPIHNARFSIGMTDEKTMLFIAKKLNLELKSRVPKNKKHRKVFELRANGSDKVKEIIDLIYPYLVSKRKQADYCYKMIHHKKRCTNLRLTKKMLEYREKIFYLTSSLNLKKGINSFRIIPDRKIFCKRCLKSLPEDFKGEFHKNCYKKRYKEKFNTIYRRNWERNYYHIPSERWRKP